MESGGQKGKLLAELPCLHTLHGAPRLPAFTLHKAAFHSREPRDLCSPGSVFLSLAPTSAAYVQFRKHPLPVGIREQTDLNGQILSGLRHEVEDGPGEMGSVSQHVGEPDSSGCSTQGFWEKWGSSGLLVFQVLGITRRKLSNLTCNEQNRTPAWGAWSLPSLPAGTNAACISSCSCCRSGFAGVALT